MRKIITSADPLNAQRAINEIASLLKGDKYLDLCLEALFEHLHKLSQQQDIEDLEAMINYLSVTVEAYI